VATLVWRRAVGGEQVFTIDRPEVTIGRDPSNSVRVDSAYVSKRHAVIRASGGGFAISDLGSSNGTRLNGAAVTSAALSDGDLIELGAETLLFHSAEQAQPRQDGGRHRLVMWGGGAAILVCAGALAASMLVGRGPAGRASQPAQSPVRPEAQAPAPAAPVVAPQEAAAPVRDPGGVAPNQEAGELYDMALAHIRGGRLAEARGLLARAGALDPGNPSVRERLREVSETLRLEVDRRLAEGQRAFTYLRFDEAIAQWEQVLGMIDSDDPRREQARAGIERARARLAER
jgi:hypothetical protein